MIIIKVGGGALIDKTAIVKDIKALNEKIVFVHGANKVRDELAIRLGVPTKKITSPSGQVSVLTDENALEILVMGYSLENKKWVSAFQKEGINAVGLSGADGRIWEGFRKKHLFAKEGRKEKLIKDTWTGRVNKVNTSLVKLLVKNDYTPVITQPAISSESDLINTDNDLNVSTMAGAMGVTKLVVLFEAPGMLKNPNDETSLIKEIKKKELPKMLQFGQGTMKKKILAASEALKNGVKEIYWGDARIKNPVRSVLNGKGTLIR